MHKHTDRMTFICRMSIFLYVMVSLEREKEEEREEDKFQTGFFCLSNYDLLKSYLH